MRIARQFKKFIPHSLAILLGGIIIVGAVKGGSVLFTDNSSGNTDNSWKSALSIIPGDKSFARVERGTVQMENPSLSATSTTGIISQKILLEYAALQKRTGNAEISDSDAEAIAAKLTQDIKLPPKTEYALSDLNISKDNGSAALETYKSALTVLANELTAANKKDVANKEDALSVVTMASETQNSSILEKLNPIIARHQTLAKNLLALKTPSTASEMHLHLTQSIEDLRAAMTGLQKIITDPIVALAAITEYQKGAADLYATVDEYVKFFDTVNQ